MLNDGSIIGGASIEVILMEELQNLKSQITANIRTTGEWASGATAASMRVTVSGNTGELTGRKAFGTLETGRKPGRIPRNMRDIIYEWMQHKGIHGMPMPYVRGGKHKYNDAQVRGDMSLAGAIAYTIKTRGTSLYREGGRDDVYSHAIPETIARINARLGGIFKANIEQQIKLNLQEI